MNMDTPTYIYSNQDPDPDQRPWYYGWNGVARDKQTKCPPRYKKT